LDLKAIELGPFTLGGNNGQESGRSGGKIGNLDSRNAPEVNNFGSLLVQIFIKVHSNFTGVIEPDFFNNFPRLGKISQYRTKK
jgi:hypothetical protein